MECNKIIGKALVEKQHIKLRLFHSFHTEHYFLLSENSGLQFEGFGARMA
jgi:hypothetical protein